jgi:hypothetical protein
VSICALTLRDRVLPEDKRVMSQPDCRGIDPPRGQKRRNLVSLMKIDASPQMRASMQRSAHRF